MTDETGALRGAAAPSPSAIPVFAAASLAVYAALVLKNAWLGDDAYIAFRTVDNFVGGHGLRFNVDERVQTFTNPLWTLVVSAAYFVTHEIYYTAISLSVAASLAAAAWLFFKARGVARVVAGVLLVASKAYVDYSTSGLEDPLSHLLLVVFLGRLLFSERPRAGIWDLALVASLAAVNRLDAVLIYLPPLAYCWAKSPRRGRATAKLLAGMTPLLAWLAFATFYFGFPYPNTACSKLAAGATAASRIAQGGEYLLDSLAMDPWTLPTIVAGVVSAFFVEDRAARAVAAGATLHVVYVVAIGGDFMSGRFLAAPYLAAAVLIVRNEGLLRRKILVPAAALLVAALAVSAPRHLLSGPRYGDVPLERTPYGDLPLSLLRTGVCDERAFYYQATGLFRLAQTGGPRHPWAEAGLEARTAGRRVVEWPSLGFFAFHAGPDVHVVDRAGTVDAFVARLPALPGPHRAGHVPHVVPAGYFESLEAGVNLIEDPNLHAYYDAVRIATRAPLLSSGRLATIWKLNTGASDALVDAYAGKLK